MTKRMSKTMTLAVLAGTGTSAWLAGSALGADGPADVSWRADACAAAAMELEAAANGSSADLPLTPASVTFPAAMCFDPLNPPSQEMMNRVNEFMVQSWLASLDVHGGWGDRYNASTRWSGGSFGSTGDPINLTWSLVPDGLNIPGGIGEPASASQLFARWDSRLARASWLALFQQSFDRWQALTGCNYTRVTSGGNDWDDGAAWGTGVGTNRGHVRIAMHTIDGLSGVLAYNSFPQNGDMVLDLADLPASGTSNFANSSNNYRFFRNTVMHEHGHGLGFAHVCSSDSNQLMEPFLSTAFDGPQQDDIRAGQRFYGDINEIDNGTAQAVFAGNLTAGGTITLGTVPAPAVANASTLSIDANGELDHHKVTVSGKLLMNATLTPIGSTYDDGDQTGSGCADGPQTNAKAQANLVLSVLDSAGTLLFTVDAAASGLNETPTNLLLSGPGDFLVRISESDAPTQTQLYTLAMTGVATSPSVTASDGTFNNKVALSWTSLSSATNFRVKRNTANNYAGAATLTTLGAVTAFDDATAVPGTTYFYWVDASMNGAAYQLWAGPDTGFAQSTSNPPGPFNLLTPADGSGNVSLTPTLTWSASSNAASYTVKVDNNSDLSSPFINQAGVVGTSFIVPGGNLANCSTYYWGVTAVNADGSTPSTPAIFSFSTRIPADFNGDGFVSGDDFDAYVAAFENGDIAADFNGDGFLSGDDFDAFVEAFNAGC